MAEEKPRYLIFLGCVIPYRLSSYEVSTRKVLQALGVELVEMPEYNCCGFPMDPVNHDTMLTLAARNLCVAEREGLNILTLCNGCFGTLYKVNKTLKEEEEEREKINGYLKEFGMEFKGTIEVKHLVHVLTEDIGFEKIKGAVKKPLTNLRVAQHTGCHIVRPKKLIGKDDPEDPKLLKELIRLTGAKCLDYMDEAECCGNPIIGVNETIPFSMAKEKFDHIMDVGAQALITVCPFCHMMYDLNQPRIERAFNTKIGIPVLHYPQLLGLAMGFTPEELAINELRVKPTQLLEQI
ncbi:MAG TPA: CoB--CoM heterodisulfide reductase subunit B [Candidatus Bathyarchaeota archaeon]|nr:MAG: CoB--CoM heterodisulfide reductase subunit B [Candidatus Bathyarchaeota archaeon]RLI18914.1 MAG: CoB--CoM heterodisulfide reductase subunit B [Candidatus Bathyarchaeota archaeon]HDI07222.1 CoB--CoM heterodisulfide reductase subunit B [Candidatus Bathyarchaeota archaeon]